MALFIRLTEAVCDSYKVVVDHKMFYWVGARDNVYVSVGMMRDRNIGV